MVSDQHKLELSDALETSQIVSDCKKLVLSFSNQISPSLAIARRGLRFKVHRGVLSITERRMRCVFAATEQVDSLRFRDKFERHEIRSLAT